MARSKDTPPLASLEEAITVLFCLIDDAYRFLDPGADGRCASLKKLSDSEVLTLALLQQLRGVQSERSFLRDAQRFFARLFPGLFTTSERLGRAMLRVVEGRADRFILESRDINRVGA